MPDASMPQIPHAIELHDSRLSGIEQKGRDIHLLFTPAYLHRDGKGWTQEVEIAVHDATMEGGCAAFPATVADGHMKTRLGPYHNLLDIPFCTGGPVTLELEFLSGQKITIHGNGVSHQFKSEPVFVEEFPGA